MGIEYAKTCKIHIVNHISRKEYLNVLYKG